MISHPYPENCRVAEDPSPGPGESLAGRESGVPAFRRMPSTGNERASPCTGRPSSRQARAQRGQASPSVHEAHKERAELPGKGQYVICICRIAALSRRLLCKRSINVSLEGTRRRLTPTRKAGARRHTDQETLSSSLGFLKTGGGISPPPRCRRTLYDAARRPRVRDADTGSKRPLSSSLGPSKSKRRRLPPPPGRRRFSFPSFEKRDVP